MFRMFLSWYLQECRMFFSYTLDCWMPHYMPLCDENIYSYETSKSISCAFFKEVVLQCGRRSYVWNIWRTVTGCGRCLYKTSLADLNVYIRHLLNRLEMDDSCLDCLSVV